VGIVSADKEIKMFRIGRLSIQAINQGKRGYGSDEFYADSYLTASHICARVSWKKRLLTIVLVVRKRV
jgi:hypothetical protein